MCVVIVIMELPNEYEARWNLRTKRGGPPWKGAGGGLRPDRIERAPAKGDRLEYESK